MSFQVQSYPGTAPPPTLLALLKSHLPYSLPVLRRLQFSSRVAGGSSPSAHIISVHGSETDHFAAAYYDPSRGPETECWVYSTLEDSVPPNPVPTSSTALPAALPDQERDICVQQLLLLLRRLRALEATYSTDCAGKGVSAEVYREPGSVRIGTLHETVRQLLISAGVGIRATSVVPKGQDWEYYGKWLVRVEDVTDADKGLEPGMVWDTVRREDAEIIKSRTSIPKREDTLVVLPSTVIRLEDGTPIAWVFLGLDGSVSTLHVEEPYRGRGLAKTITRRLLRDHTIDFGDDGWGSTDISTTNLQSQGVFKSIGGKPAWTVSWLYLDLLTVGKPIETDNSF